MGVPAGDDVPEVTARAVAATARTAVATARTAVTATRQTREDDAALGLEPEEGLVCLALGVLQPMALDERREREVTKKTVCVCVCVYVWTCVCTWVRGCRKANLVTDDNAHR